MYIRLVHEKAGGFFGSCDLVAMRSIKCVIDILKSFSFPRKKKEGKGKGWLPLICRPRYWY